MKKWLIFLMVFILGGCGAKKGNQGEAYKRIVEDYGAHILLQDQDSAAYDRVLEETAQYLENPSGDKLGELRKLVEETSLQFAEAADACEAYALEEDFGKLLQEYDIDPEEYVFFADMRSALLAEYVNKLYFLDYYLEAMEEDALLRPQLEFTHEMHEREQSISRGYYYCSINYWFAGWEGEALLCVQEEILDKLKSYQGEAPIWEDNREAVEARLHVYVSQKEQLLDVWAEYVGERQEELYRMEAGLSEE